MSSRSAPVAGRGQRLDASPLYRQVEAILTQRIAEGVWAPGSLLPAEPEIAADLGVSQGTVRKALDGLERRFLIERHQGRGTFVASQTIDRALEHFFPLVDADGRRSDMTCEVLEAGTRLPTGTEAARLGLREGEAVHWLLRIRRARGRVRLVERIVLPVPCFPAFDRLTPQEIPDQLYVLYQRRFGITVARADDRIGAVAADAATGAILGLPAGAPLLEVERLAFDIQGRPVEARLWLLDSRDDRYHAALS